MKRIILLGALLVAFILILHSSRTFVDKFSDFALASVTKASHLSVVNVSSLAEESLQYLLSRIESTTSSQILEDLQEQKRGVLGRVIYRDPACWGSTLWINLGALDNHRYGGDVVAKNSPVLLGDSVIGVVEYVGKKRSRIRLITDQNLHVAVRAVRGEGTQHFITYHVDQLQKYLEWFHGQNTELLTTLDGIRAKLQTSCKVEFLAKGEVFGASQPLWRSRNQHLQGVGFNYDFADDKGGERELRSGELLEDIGKGEGIRLIEKGDLLVTSGMDGVFPEGLCVGIVTYVAPLKDSDIAFEIEAAMTAGNLDDLSYVTILPPIPYH